MSSLQCRQLRSSCDRHTLRSRRASKSYGRLLQLHVRHSHARCPVSPRSRITGIPRPFFWLMLPRTTTITITPTSYSVVGSNAKRTAAPDVPIVAAGQKGAVDYASLFVPNPAFNTAAPAVTARGIAARQVTQVPNLVPIYASACSGTVRYSSACSCAGITASTTYAPTPVGRPTFSV